MIPDWCAFGQVFSNVRVAIFQNRISPFTALTRYLMSESAGCVYTLLARPSYVYHVRTYPASSHHCYFGIIPGNLIVAIVEVICHAIGAL